MKKRKLKNELLSELIHKKEETPDHDKSDRSPVISQRSKLKHDLKIFERKDFTETQKKFLELVFDKNTKMIFVSGPAGTAKTYLSVYAALTLLNQKRISDIIYVRSAVESSDSKIGFLPGEVDDKMAPYIDPLLDKLDELLSKGDIDVLKKDKRISGVPVGFLRGKNWNAKVVIADEAQNMSWKELVTFITRIGEFSKVLILGDPLQSDINGRSGFVRMVETFSGDDDKQEGIHVFKLTDEDIVRSKLVRHIIKKLEKIKT
jgi:phosphate starvation-inducible PhoH-like protein